MHPTRALTTSATRGLGALTGLVSLIAMARLVGGAFEGAMSTFAWAFLLLAMVPWVAYVAWRAGHGRLGSRAVVAVLLLCLGGLVAVWLSTLGVVVALTASLAAFVVIWVHDWPAPRRAGESRFVRIDELGAEDDPEDAPEGVTEFARQPEAA